MKKCTKCKILKEESFFYKDSAKKDLLSSECKNCTDIRNNLYKINNKEKYSLQRKVYTKEHKEEKSLYDKQYRHKIETRYKRCQFDSKRRNISFNLTFDQFVEITSNSCYYCKSFDERNFCGIDRVDSNIGYVVQNCVACCKTCNYMKLELTVEQWMNHMKKVLETYSKRKST